MNRTQGRCEKQEGKGTDGFEALKVQTLSERFVKNDFILPRRGFSFSALCAVSCICLRAFEVVLPSVWDQLPQMVPLASSLILFISSLKYHLLNDTYLKVPF